MRIIEASESDRPRVLQVEREAFAREDEAKLVAALLNDPTAQPAVSLLALEGARPIGHVLFTRATLTGGEADVACAILAPLAVIPAMQRQGVGKALIERGCELLAVAGVKLVFVLGDPAYYTRRGFEPAIPLGLRPPYPVVPEEAWMVRALAPQIQIGCTGTVACPATLANPQLWRE